MPSSRLFLACGLVKKLLIAENLGLTEGESKGFWPVYEEYQKELEAINQRPGKAIQR